jgi:hypothetical protein
MGLLHTIREELPTIRQAPLSIGLTVLILTAAVSVAIYAGFRENLSRKDDLIGTLREQLEAAKKALPALPESVKPSSGDATAAGEGNTANSGNGSTVNGQSQIKK